MRYIGSKVSTKDMIYDIVSKHIPGGSFCDPFGGIATMSSHFKSKNYEVHTSDILTFAHYFQIAKLKYNSIPKFKNLFQYLYIRSSSDFLEYMNQLKPEKGWFTFSYSTERTFFSFENAQKIEAIRYQIKEWDNKQLISEDEKAFLLASLINSVDKVANTAGTYYAYLKGLDRKASRPFKFTFIQPVRGEKKAFCHQLEANELLKKYAYDVIYLDPPYNQRNYSRYYHLPEVLAKQIEPEVSGKAGIPKMNHLNSDFNNRIKSLESFQKIMDNSEFKLLLFQYTDNGLLKKDEIISILESKGDKVDDFYIDSLGYSTQSHSRNDKHHIYVVKR